MQKLLFVGHDFKFLIEIISFFKEHSDFEIKFDHWEGNNKHNVEKSYELLAWADVIIAEWCLGNAVWYSEHKLPHQKLFVRLHRFEASREYIKELKIKNIDKIIFIAPHIKREVEVKLKLPKEKSIIIYNTTRVKIFSKKKSDGFLYNIGLLGYHKKRKRPDRAIDIFERLKKKDDRYKLFLKGHHPSVHMRDKDYFDKLFKRIEQSPYRDSIIIEEFDNQVAEWFQKIGFILSTSEHEGSHQTISEGMASGSIPFIMGWDGAKGYYPSEFVKKKKGKIVKSIRYYTKNKMKYKSKQKEVISFCKKNFDVDVICQQWLSMISK